MLLKSLKILIIDGQGGGLGRAIAEQIKSSPELKSCCIITAVGTNSVAAATMLKGGADYAASGENAVLSNVRNADIIIGAIGVCFADSMHGEISSVMAEAVCKSLAIKLLLPITKCKVSIMGVQESQLNVYISEAIEYVKNYARLNCVNKENKEGSLNLNTGACSCAGAAGSNANMVENTNVLENNSV